jgi:two-component system, chemotaxis family, protein-glutamate methylesterase/glutaminase
MKKRVMIVDDSVVMRRLLSDLVESLSDDFELAGTAANGRIALKKLPRLYPDIIILDIEMPEMNGIELIQLLGSEYPQIPVVVFSSWPQEKIKTHTLEIYDGKIEIVEKPSNIDAFNNAQEFLYSKLVPVMLSLVGEDADTVIAEKQLRKTLYQSKPATLSNRIDIVLVGVSTGGPKAVEVMLLGLPKNLPVPLVMVQHMPPVFTKYFAQRMEQKTKLCVREALHGECLLPGRIYVAPGDYHICLAKTDNKVKILLNQDPPENSCRPSVDVLFKSAVGAFGQNILGVILTGMGVDGLAGSEAIYNASGQIVVQDQSTSVIWSMPGSVATCGYAEEILPIEDIAHSIIRRLRYQRKEWVPTF